MKAELPILTDGTITLCPHQRCDHTCCDFSSGNFIALYPGELAQAKAAGLSVEHLNATPDGAGGHRAICRAVDRASCDQGYKPLDCASYPLFPEVTNSGAIEASLKGSKCPLADGDLTAHQVWVEDRWSQIAGSQAELIEWLRTVELVGYQSSKS